MFGTLIVDVSNPASMGVPPLNPGNPGNPGTRNAYLRVNCDTNILAIGEDSNAQNPNQPGAGERLTTGVAFYDVAAPHNPVQVSIRTNNPGGTTQGM